MRHPQTTSAPSPERLALIHNARPLFLLGTPRSGTTLLARLLNAHRRVLMTNETAVMLQLGDMISRSERGSQAGILFGKQYHELWARHLSSRSRELIETYYARIADEQGRRDLAYWGEKHPHNCHCLDLIASNWPQARYIYLVRDPRDAGLSIAAMLDKPFRTSLENWKTFSDRYEAFADELPEQQCLRLRYEDLVDDYAGVTRRFLRWLGLDLDEGVEQYIESYKDVDAHSVAPLMEQGREPRPRQKCDYRRKAVERWKKRLSRRDVRFATKLVGSFLEKYGYEIDGRPRLKRPVQRDARDA